MAVKRLEIHPAALAELSAITSWYSKQSYSAADKFVEEIDRAMDWIKTHSELWPLGEYGTRKFILRRFPYAIFYREKEEMVQILAVAHGHRRPGYWTDRL